jgi:hypothetical protein
LTFKLFMAVIYKILQYIRVFVTVRHYHPSLIMQFKVEPT